MTSPSRGSDGAQFGALTAAFVLHLAGVGVLLRSILAHPAGDGLAILTGDYALYIARALRTILFQAASHRYWGYDPFAMAGYPFNAVHETGSLFFSLAARAVHPLISPGALLLALEVGSLAALPLPVVYFTKRLSPGAAPAAALAVAAIMYGRFGVASVEPWMHGFLPFQIAAFLMLIQVGSLWSWLESRRRGPLALFAALTALIPMIHPGSVIASALGVGAVVAVEARGLDKRAWASLAGVALLCLAVNAFWIRPFVSFRSWIVETPYFNEIDGEGLARRLNPVQKSLFTMLPPVLNGYVIAGAVWGALALWRSNRRRIAGIGLWCAALIAIGVVGGPFKLHSAAGPGRYVLVLEAIVYALAGVGAARILTEKQGRRVAIAALVIGLAAAAAVDARDVLTGQRRLSNRFVEEQRQVIDYLKGPGKIDGRTLIESEPGNEPHFLDLVPLLTGAHVLGGSNAGNFLKSRFTVYSGVHFKNGKPVPLYVPNVFGKPISEFTADEFAAYLKLYNVRQILAWSTESQHALNRLTDAVGTGPWAGDHLVYRAKFDSGWLVEGQGRVSADYDKIVVADASRGKLILSFHWIDTLRADDGVAIRPVTVLDAPVPFIEIDNPEGRSVITIRNAGL